MAGVAQPERIGSELVFERIAEVIDRQRRYALIEFAVAEYVWHRPGHAVTGFAGPESVACSQHAA